MSSSDASDLVDSDDAAAASSPPKPQQRLLLVKDARASTATPEQVPTAAAAAAAAASPAARAQPKRGRPSPDAPAAGCATGKKRSRLERSNGSILGAGSRGMTGKGRASRGGASCSQPSAAAFPGSCAGTAGRRYSLRKKPSAEESSPGWISCSSSSSSSSSEKADPKVSKSGRAASSKRVPNKRVLNRGNNGDSASAPSTAAKTNHRSCPVSPGTGAAAGYSVGKAADPADPPGNTNTSFATHSAARRLRSSGGCASTSGGSDDENAFEEPNQGRSGRLAVTARERRGAAPGGSDAGEGHQRETNTRPWRLQLRVGQAAGATVTSFPRGGDDCSTHSFGNCSRMGLGSKDESGGGDKAEGEEEEEYEEQEEQEQAELGQDGQLMKGRPGSQNTTRGGNSATRNEGSTAATAQSRTRTGSKERGESEMRDLNSDDEHLLCSRAPLKTKATTGSGDSGGRGGGNITLEPAIDLALSGDDDDCLVDTDSDVESNGSQSVLCRCGGRDAKDGSCWISCDGRGCRTWEHLRCAYPERAAAAVAEGEEEDDEEGEDNPPEIHFCDRCKAKGFAAGVRSSGGSSLSRGGGSAATNPSSRSPSIGFSPSKRIVREGSVANSKDVEVRRSRRVMRREGIRTLLRKNVVGSEASSTPSSSDGADVAGGRDSGVGACLGGGINDSDEDDSDGFWAPEGQVEASEEFRCRCGATHQDEGVIGALNGGAVVVDGDGASGGCRWMQCRSDSCGIWEHAACCEHGCSAGVAPGSPAPAANRKHWCRSCDPKGKKHARWKQRLRNSSRKRKLREAGRGRRRARAGLAETPGAIGAAGGGGPTPRRRQAVDERSRALLRRLWGAVASADVVSVEQVLLEVKGNSGEESESAQRRLLEEQPPRRGVDAQFDGDSGGGEGMTTSATESADVVSDGVSVLMLAAGHWKSVANDAAVLTSAERIGAGVAEAPASELDSGEGAAAAGRNNGSDLAAASTTVHREGNPEAEGENKGSGGDSTVMSKAPVLPADADGQPARAVVVSVDEPQQTGESAEGGAASATVENAPPLGSEARLGVLRLLLARTGERSVLAVDAEGRTAVHHAAEVGASREAALLLRGEVGGQASLAKSLRGLTPLHVAAAAGYAETCATMLGALAPRPRAAALAANDAASGETAFHLACVEGRADCVRAILCEESKLEMLLKEEEEEEDGKAESRYRPMVLTRTLQQTTPLMAAAGCPSLACVKLVLQNLQQRVFRPAGSKLAELRATDEADMNALHWAAGRNAEGSVEAAKAVLELERLLSSRGFSYHHGSGQQRGATPEWDPRAMINGGDAANGASPLHLAAAVSHKEMVALLVEEGANSVLLDGRGWTPVMYADFDGRKEGAILELLQHEPEKQLEALGKVLSSSDGRNHHPRVVEVVRNLVTVPAFFSLVNGFVRKNPGLLLTTLGFLRDEPGLLDFENKRNLLRTLLANPDLATRAALDVMASPPTSGFGFDYCDRIDIRRGPGVTLSALLRWMEAAARRWGESGLAAWLRVRQPSFHFDGEAGYGPGVDREAWESIAEDLVVPVPAKHPFSGGSPVNHRGGDGKEVVTKNEAFFVPVDGGMASYCPRDLRTGERGEAGVGAGGGGGGGSGRAGNGKDWREEEEDLRAFELLGIVIGANLGWNKVLNLNLNPVVWKAVLSRKVHLADLDLVDEMYYRSLKQVLGKQGADDLGLSFGCLELRFCVNGGGVDPDDDVTDGNKERYAALALESRTYGRWRKQARAMAQGLKRLVPLSLLKMFNENELGLLLAGPGEIDPEDWERHTVFSGEATEALRGWFWSVVRALTKEERSLLLQFATGCSRLPAGGFSGLSRPFKVVMLNYHPARPLPMAATCFFMLKLPQYPDLYSLRKNLLVAIRHGAAGFEFS